MPSFPGTPGNDSLTGTNEADDITGLAGSDRLQGLGGNDLLDGGADIDTADYSEKTLPVVVALNGSSNATVTVGGIAEDTIRNIENVRGGSHDDTLTGDAAGNAFYGRGGGDTLDGGAGRDTADYSDKTQSVVVTLNGATFTTVSVGGIAEDTIRNIENIIGGSGNDYFIGDEFDNTFNGGAGVDTADYSDETQIITVILAGSGTGIVQVNNVSEDNLRNVENVIGGGNNDRLLGDTAANELSGGEGNDTLFGGPGMDTLDGGSNTDWAYYDDKTKSIDVTLNGSTNATVTVGGVAEDTIRNIENVLGGFGDDTLTGDAVRNILYGGGGADTLSGGGGDDVLSGEGLVFTDEADDDTLDDRRR